MLRCLFPPYFRLKSNYVRETPLMARARDLLRLYTLHTIDPFNKANVCSFFFTGLRHLCQELDNCEDGMVCEPENATKPAAFGAKVSTSQYKICLCDEVAGYEESISGHHCSKAANFMAGTASTIVSLLMGFILAQKQIQ